MKVFGRLGDGEWHLVTQQGEDACTLGARAVSFDALWSDGAAREAGDATITCPWGDLLLPLPRAEVPCVGYGLSYRSHQRETVRGEPFMFPKAGPAVRMGGRLEYRDHLDFEAEVGVLFHRASATRFGFLMANDVTDREIQVRLHGIESEAASCAKAKSFEGALAVGPLLAVGDVNDWHKLEIDLRLNGQLMQSVRPLDCVLDLNRVHREVFAEHPDEDWVLVLTGTPSGTLFRKPRPLERLSVLVSSGFSVPRAKVKWLARLRFLNSGDVVEFTSPQLGYGRSVVS